MKLAFERKIESYKKLAKGKVGEAEKEEISRIKKDVFGEVKEENPQSEVEKKELQGAINWELREEIRKRKTSEGDQRKIFKIEKEKEILKRNLGFWLREENIDLIEKQKGERSVVGENGAYKYQDEKGEWHEITIGEIMTDGSWGVDYHLDPQTVPRRTRRRYLIEKARMVLGEELDDQILIEEKGKEPETCMENGKKAAYERLLEEREKVKKEGFDKAEAGHLAETMVMNFLKKIRFDLETNDGGMPEYEVIETDVHEDVENKIDFIVRVKKKGRGVRVEEEDIRDVAFQLTISENKKIRSKKREQLSEVRKKILDDSELKISDIILVIFPEIKRESHVENWIEAGKPAGGPDKLWSADLKKQVFSGIMQNLASKEEIEAVVKKIEEREKQDNQINL